MPEPEKSLDDKFKDVPVEPDTKILFSQVARLDEYDVLYQKWFWDGFCGESVIFVAEDVIKKSDRSLKKMISELPIVTNKKQITIKRSEVGYVFVNFNFSQ